MYRRRGRSLWFVALILSLAGGCAMAQASNETFGCESNPTGDPIGGGAGYRDTRTRGDFTVRTAGDLLAALQEAREGQVIFVPAGVEIDMAGQENLVIPGGVTLAGGCGREGSSRGRIVMKRRQKKIYYLFETGGDHVRLTGIHAIGPDGDPDVRSGYCNFIRTTHYGLEVDNCEIANWGYGAVVGQLGAARLFVHHSHIHHCMGAAHDGYGVSLDACDARVMANTFDNIRNHAISGTGQPGTAYEAAYNLVNGNFDMHGGSDRGDGTVLAGDWTEIHHNTFLQVRALNWVMRGFSSQGNRVHHNWLLAPLKDSMGYTKEELARRNTDAYRNVHGPERILEE